jgi:hypothetical protein
LTALLKVLPKVFLRIPAIEVEVREQTLGHHHHMLTHPGFLQPFTDHLFRGANPAGDGLAVPSGSIDSGAVTGRKSIEQGEGGLFVQAGAEIRSAKGNP